MHVQFAVLLHVNRSGSTFLSRVMRDSSPDIFVFPETLFLIDLIAGHDGGHAHAGEALYDIITADPRRDALAIDDDRLRAICARNSSADIPALLTDLAVAVSGRMPKAIVLKLGVLIYFSLQMRRIFADLKFIHIARDPRSVCNSMLKSELPEKPGFDMARGSIVFAAREWRSYVNLVRAIERDHPVTWIRYEDLRADSLQICRLLLDELGLAPDTAAVAAPAARYRISGIDNKLHALVYDDFNADRVEAWRNELPDRSVRIVETLCRHEMELLGYRHDTPRLRAWQMVPVLAQHVAAISRHNLRTLRVYSRRRGGLAALWKRVHLALQVSWNHHVLSRRAASGREAAGASTGIERDVPQTI
jgi:hypothetical protein